MITYYTFYERNAIVFSTFLQIQKEDGILHMIESKMRWNMKRKMHLGGKTNEQRREKED